MPDPNPFDEAFATAVRRVYGANASMPSAPVSAAPAAAPADPFDAAFKQAVLTVYGKPNARAQVENDEITKGAKAFPGEGSDALSGLSQAALNLLAGGIRGTGSIGATLARPFESKQENEQRRANIDKNMESVGAQPDSLVYKGGKIGAEIAGTAGVGNAIAAPIRAVAALAPAAAPALNVAANTIASGGFQTGANMGRAADIATRVAGGAVAGGAGAALVSGDAKDTAIGAGIGGALPPALKAAGWTIDKAWRFIRNAATPQDVKIAQQLADQLGITADDLAAVMTGPQAIPGYKPTVPQIVQDPVASQLQRSLKTAGTNAIGDAEKLQQQQFMDTLRTVGPVANTTQDAAAVAGSAIQDFAKPAQRAATKAVGDLFDAIPAQELQVHLPLQEMLNAQQKYLGPGTFGKGAEKVEQALRTAETIGMDAATMQSRVVPFDQIQALRSSIGEAISQAEAAGQNKAAAALTQMKAAIDNKLGAVLSGGAAPGEIVTPAAVDAYGQALAAHVAKQQQFATGPQSGMFRMGADRQAAVQGAEIPGKFFNGNRSQADDVQAFKRLVGNRKDLEQVMKGYAMTEGAATSNQAGDLTQKFLNWMDSRSGALSQLLSKEELLKVQSVGRALEKSLTAENLGRVSGSDTAQKLASLQRLGILDSKAVDYLANRIPVVGQFTGPAVKALRDKAMQTRQGVMADLLADPARMEQALRTGAARAALPAPTTPGAITQGTQRVLPVMGAGALGGAAVEEAAQPAPPAPAGPISAAPAEDHFAAIAAAPTVDDAIASAGAAVTQTLDAHAEHVAQNTPAPARVRQVELPPAEPGGQLPVAIWTGRRGGGYVSEQDAQNALPTRQRMNPELAWAVEQMPNGLFRLAAYEPQGAMASAAEDGSVSADHVASAPAVPEVAPEMFRASITPAGTAMVQGDPMKLRQVLAHMGITNMVPTRGGVIVGTSQAQRAMDLLRAAA